MKVRKSVSRRIKVTAGGKLLRRRSFARHLKAGKKKGRIRNLKRGIQVKGSLEKKLRNVMGVGN